MLTTSCSPTWKRWIAALAASSATSRLAHLHNAGLSDEELQTYRNALTKLVNSLSWGPRSSIRSPIDPPKTVLPHRPALVRVGRDDLEPHPAGVPLRHSRRHHRGAGRDRSAPLTKVPVVRADWFVATASRAPLYYDVLQLPASLTELEKPCASMPFRTSSRSAWRGVGFNGSGVSRFNRILERHDSAHGMYWRTYDFDEPPANLVDRANGNLLPDRAQRLRLPARPGRACRDPFQHAGGEAIFALPNGLHAYYIANADNNRLDKAPIAIVSDPEAARPRRRGRRVVHDLPRHRHSAEGRSDASTTWTRTRRRSRASERGTDHGALSRQGESR